MDDIGERGGVAYTGTRAVIFELLPVVIEDWSGVVVVGGHGEDRATHIMFGGCLDGWWKVALFPSWTCLVVGRVRLR